MAAHAAAVQTADALEHKLRTIQLAAARAAVRSAGAELLPAHASGEQELRGGEQELRGGEQAQGAEGLLGQVQSSMQEHLKHMQELRAAAAACSLPRSRGVDGRQSRARATVQAAEIEAEEIS